MDGGPRVRWSNSGAERALWGKRPGLAAVANYGLGIIVSTLFMAKTAWINRNERKRATAKEYAALRASLKAKKDYAGLAQLPRDASPTRVVNRCEVSGRRRAFIRRFKMSRLAFRELASQGLIPGVTKSSW